METSITVKLNHEEHKTEDVLSDVYTILATKDNYIRILKEKIKTLSDEHFRDKEIERLTNELEKMRNDYYRGFPISEKEIEAINKWKTKHYKGLRFGACGGGFTYRFVPTGIGTSGVIVGPDGKEFEFQEIG